MNDTCPHCGALRAAITSDGRFACGSVGGSRSPLCYSHQLAAVTAERDALARRIAEAPVVQLCELGNFTLCERSINPERDEELRRFGYNTVRVRLVRDDDNE